MRQKNVENYRFKKHFKKFSLLKYVPIRESDSTRESRKVEQDRLKQQPLLEEFEGTVEGMVFGGKAVRVGYVKGGRVYQQMYGGRDRPIGHVEGDIAYKNVFGGKAMPIGHVRYYDKNNQNIERR